MFWRTDSQLSELRRRLRQARRGDRAGANQAARARQLAAQLAAFAGTLRCCASCARHTDPPHGCYSGGFCCGGSTRDLFCDDELAALGLVGVKPSQLRAPAQAQAGCLFRGPTGCALPAARRPIICTRHFCSEALRELHDEGRLRQVELSIAALDAAFDGFKRARCRVRRSA